MRTAQPSLALYTTTPHLPFPYGNNALAGWPHYAALSIRPRSMLRYALRFATVSRRAPCTNPSPRYPPSGLRSEQLTPPAIVVRRWCRANVVAKVVCGNTTWFDIALPHMRPDDSLNALALLCRNFQNSTAGSTWDLRHHLP